MSLVISLRVIVLALLAVVPVAVQCSESSPHEIAELYRQGFDHWPQATIDEGIDYQPLAAISKQVPSPASNPLTGTKRELGKHLFFDRRLSASEQIACASCHDPDLGWADGRRTSIGHDRQKGDINAPTVVNSAWLTQVFWDGRAASLEEQVIASWTNPIEMAADTSVVIDRLRETQSYPELFKQAFGTEEITSERVAQAIASFMRSLTLTSTPFDRFMRGDIEAMSDEALHGLHLFRTKARCINCHHGAQLSDHRFHHLGTSFHNVGAFQGRYRLTGAAVDVGAFRTPSLRGALNTPPFMHNGFVKDLDTLMAFYNMGWWQNADLPDKGNDIPTAQLSPVIKPLSLDAQELRSLKEFLKSLTGTMPWMEVPKSLP